MVRPSKPKLMARVLEAVTHLAEGKGSLTRDVLDFVKQNSTGSKRNLTMQVQRALKHAVNAGLLSCKSGRYKMQLALNPISHHQPVKRHRDEETDRLKNVEVSDEINDNPPIGGTDPSRKVKNQLKSSRRKRSIRKIRRRSGNQSSRRRSAKRRSARMRKANKKSRRRRKNDDIDEDWPTRRRRMMAKPKYEDDDEDDDEEEEEEEEEDEGIRYTRDGRKMKSTNEDSASYVSGDSNSVGRHRSRRSKHLTNDRRSPSRRANGDTESPRKSRRRSTSRRRSQKNQRETRRESDPEEAGEQVEGLDKEHENEDMEQDEDQENVERVGTLPEENQGAE